jgi:hypothetical protein
MFEPLLFFEIILFLLRRNGGHFGSFAWLDAPVISRFLRLLAKTHFLLKGIEGFRLLGIHSDKSYSLTISFKVQ